MLKKSFVWIWATLSTLGCFYFSAKTDYETLYMGMDRATTHEISKMLKEKRSQFQVTKEFSEIKVPATQVDSLRKELGDKVMCLLKI